VNVFAYSTLRATRCVKSPAVSVEKMFPDRFLTDRHRHSFIEKLKSISNAVFSATCVFLIFGITHNFERLPRSRNISGDRQPILLVDRSL